MFELNEYVISTETLDYKEELILKKKSVGQVIRKTRDFIVVKFDTKCVKFVSKMAKDYLVHYHKTNENEYGIKLQELQEENEWIQHVFSSDVPIPNKIKQELSIQLENNQVSINEINSKLNLIEQYM